MPVHSECKWSEIARRAIEQELDDAELPDDVQALAQAEKEHKAGKAASHISNFSKSWVLKMSYKLFYSRAAKEALRKLDKPVQIQVLKKIILLCRNPETGKPLLNLLKGRFSARAGIIW